MPKTKCDKTAQDLFIEILLGAAIQNGGELKVSRAAIAKIGGGCASVRTTPTHVTISIAKPVEATKVKVTKEPAKKAVKVAKKATKSAR